MKVNCILVLMAVLCLTTAMCVAQQTGSSGHIACYWRCWTRRLACGGSNVPTCVSQRESCADACDDRYGRPVNNGAD